MKKALITGVTGQDGSFLSEFLLEKGYDVHGMIRRSSVDYRERIAHLEGHKHFHLHYGDLGDTMSLVKVIGAVRPDEIYNLAAQSHVQVSFDVPEFTADVDAIGVLRVLEAVRVCGLTDTCRIYQASTSELYGKVEEVPQSETTPFHPYSPYAVAKQYGFWITKEYREAYNMFCCSAYRRCTEMVIMYFLMWPSTHTSNQPITVSINSLLINGMMNDSILSGPLKQASFRKGMPDGYVSD